jgi:hypothetical protein
VEVLRLPPQVFNDNAGEWFLANVSECSGARRLCPERRLYLRCAAAQARTRHPCAMSDYATSFATVSLGEVLEAME